MCDGVMAKEDSTHRLTRETITAATWLAGMESTSWGYTKRFGDCPIKCDYKFD